MKEGIPSVNETPHEAFKFYRENSKYRKVDNTRRAKHYRKITNAFWDRVGEYMVEKSGGVFVDGMGYFSVGMVLEKRFMPKKAQKGKYYNAHTKSMVYFPVLITSKYDYFFKVFCMDRHFVPKIKKGINKKLREGFKYVNYYKEIFESFIHRYRKIKNR